MAKKIMIVDDEPDVLLSLRIIFEKEGYDVVMVDNGYDCIKEIEKGFTGVILIDIMMPGMDGWETVRQIVNRNLMDSIALEIITGRGTGNHYKINGLEAYIFDYITKPFDIDKLLSSVRKCESYIGHQ